jgi:hypothetical protein
MPSPEIEAKFWKALKSDMIKTGKFLGEVEAPDQETAEAMAVKAFKLTDEQRERLVVQERRPEARGSQAN